MKAKRNHQHPHPLDVAPAAFRDTVDQLDPLTCPREELERLMKAAPTPEVRAWLQGVGDTRKMLAAVTGGTW